MAEFDPKDPTPNDQDPEGKFTEEDLEQLPSKKEKEQDEEEFFNDRQNAALLTKHLIGLVHYVQGFGWLAWDGKKFNSIEAELILEKFAQIYREMQILSKNDDKQFKHFNSLQNISKLRNIEVFARSIFHLKAKHLDNQDMLFNCSNGVIDLKTEKLLPHSPSYFFTQISPVDFDPAAKCPTFDEFLLSAMQGDLERVELLWRILGYCITGLSTEQVVFFFHGKGLNGKSTFCEIARALLGEFSKGSNISAFLTNGFGKGECMGDIARLSQCRFVTASEPPPGAKLDESVIKQITGGEAVTARFLYEREFEYYPKYKLMISFNNEPTIRSQDEGVWRRIVKIPWEATFTKNETFKSKLHSELTGILAGAVKACRRWQEGGLNRSSKVIEATAAYRAEQDSLGRFIEDHCNLGVSLKAEKVKFRKAFNEWQVEEGEQPWSGIKLFREMKQKGFEEKKNNNLREWVGIETSIFLKQAPRDWNE